MLKILYLAVISVASFFGYNYFSDSDPQMKIGLPSTIRMTTTGNVIGYQEENNSHAWLGIPYAESPIEKRRWRAPKPAKKWTGTFAALKLGNVCTQLGTQQGGVSEDLFDEPIGSEDCLYLNIWAPEFDIKEIPAGKNRLPVMFWIHGGGNSIGQGGNYPGKVLAEKYNLIVVTINYRLGPFGWFSHPALKSQSLSGEDNSGNYGTLDIIQALRWVNQNISNFGGDPGNVTVFGESAGARNTLSMMMSPKAKGLFHKAIVQSGLIRKNSLAKAENYVDDVEPGHPFSSREVVNRLLIEDELVEDRDEGKQQQQKMTGQQISSYLYGKDNYSILKAYESFAFGMLNMPNLIDDGSVLLKMDTMEQFSNKENYNDVPIILGTNRDEYKLFMVQNDDFVENYFGLYHIVRSPIYYQLVAMYKSDSWKAVGVDRIASVLRKSQGPNVYAYRFDWDEEPSIWGMDLSYMIGAAHGLEIPFVFNDFSSGIKLDIIFTEDNESGRKLLANSISSYWAEFAYNGTPGKGRKGRQIEWKPWSVETSLESRFMILDSPGDRGIRMSSDKITFKDIKKRLLSDNRFSRQEDHCRMYFDLFGNPAEPLADTSHWDNQEYLKLGRSGCKKYPVEMFKD